jgi:hypothetical protein
MSDAADGAFHRPLAELAQGEFFAWFHLELFEGDPKSSGSYRPNGAAFRDLVNLQLTGNALHELDEAKLCMDRAFIADRKNGAFARDIARSFLNWALPAGDRAKIGDLIEEIGNMAAAGAPVIRHASMPDPVLPARPSAGYRVFLGIDKDCDIDLGARKLRLVNLLPAAAGGGKDDWIWILIRQTEA